MVDSPPMVAPRSVRVVKLLRKTDEGTFISPIKKHPYHLDAENPKVNLIPDKGNCINEGYHAYLNEQTILNLYRNFKFKTIKELEKKTPYTVGVFEIPLGTTYFVNSRNEVVTENLIFKDLL